MRKRISRLTAETLALVSAALRRDDRRFDTGEAPPARQPVGHFPRGAVRPLDHGGLPVPRAHRQEADRGRGAAPADSHRSPHLQRAGLDHGPGRQRRGRRRRAADARAGPDQQGDDRLPYPQRLQPWRQRFRGHGLHHRPVQGRRLEGPDRSEPRPRPQGHGNSDSPRPIGTRRHNRRSPARRSRARCQASTIRSSRASPSTTTRASVSLPTS